MKLKESQLRRIIKEEIQKLLLNEADIPVSIQTDIARLEQMLPYAQKLCVLLPIVCNASIQYYYTYANSELTYSAAILKWNALNGKNEDDFNNFGEIMPVIVIALGNISNVESFRILSVSTSLDEKILKAWSAHSSYFELPDFIKQKVEYAITDVNAEFKYDFDVDLD